MSNYSSLCNNKNTISSAASLTSLLHNLQIKWLWFGLMKQAVGLTRLYVHLKSVCFPTRRFFCHCFPYRSGPEMESQLQKRQGFEKEFFVNQVNNTHTHTLPHPTP